MSSPPKLSARARREAVFLLWLANLAFGTLLGANYLAHVPDVDSAIALAVEAEGGCRHTSLMHSRNLEALHRAARKVKTTIFVKNGPSVAGLGFGGEGFSSYTIATPTGEGITSARTFTRRRRCVL